MTNKILAVLNIPLHETLRQYGSQEVKKFSWDGRPESGNDAYSELLSVRKVNCK